MDHHKTRDGTNLWDGPFAKRTFSHTSNPPTNVTPRVTSQLLDYAIFAKELGPEEIEGFCRARHDNDLETIFKQTFGVAPPDGTPCDHRLLVVAEDSGSIHHPEFIMASGEMTDKEYEAFLNSVVRCLVQFSEDGSVHFLFIDWRHHHQLERVCQRYYAKQINLCVWVKSNGGMGPLYRSRHELVLVFRNGEAPHINNVQLGKFGRNRTNVWEYAGISSLRPGRLDELAMHPTTKPVALVSDAIRDCSKRRGIVLDPFIGSGTTIISAEETGRICHGIELDPRYVDVAVRKWQDFTGGKARHAATGIAFDELTDIRNASVPLLPPPAGPAATEA